MFAAALAGYVLAISLIMAIGAQNAFILRQGLKREHVFILCLICALADALLIAAGVAGLGTLIRQYPVALTTVTVGGCDLPFRLWLSGVSAGAHPDALKAGAGPSLPLRQAIAACLAFTFLNPHVYLDTVVLLGALSAVYEGQARLAYAVGALCGLVRLVLLAGLWRAAAGTGVCAAAQLAGAGHPDRPGHVGAGGEAGERAS